MLLISVLVCKKVEGQAYVEEGDPVGLLRTCTENRQL